MLLCMSHRECASVNASKARRMRKRHNNKGEETGTGVWQNEGACRWCGVQVCVWNRRVLELQRLHATEKAGRH